MNARSEALLAQAKRQGYLVMPYGSRGILKTPYYQWCLSQKTPMIQVTIYGKSASLETDTSPVWLGYYDEVGDSAPDHPLHFATTPELEARCEALVERCRASILYSNKNRGDASFHGQMSAHYIGQEMAIEAAKELWDIWQEAKQHLVFIPE